jgi:hypothetical protein
VSPTLMPLEQLLPFRPSVLDLHSKTQTYRTPVVVANHSRLGLEDPRLHLGLHSTIYIDNVYSPSTTLQVPLHKPLIEPRNAYIQFTNSKPEGAVRDNVRGSKPARASRNS